MACLCAWLWFYFVRIMSFDSQIKIRKKRHLKWIRIGLDWYFWAYHKLISKDQITELQNANKITQIKSCKPNFTQRYYLCVKFGFKICLICDILQLWHIKDQVVVFKQEEWIPYVRAFSLSLHNLAKVFKKTHFKIFEHNTDYSFI